MQDDHSEDHDRGLAFDLATISRKIMERRRALGFMLGAGATALIAGCGGGGSSSGSSNSSSGSTTASTSSSSTSSSTSTTSSTATTSSTSTTSSTATTSSTTSTTSTTSTSDSCVASPAETGGPYPADGTNTSSGSTSDILTQTGIVRSDIRSSFISTTTTAQGVQLSLTLVNSNSGCAALSGYAIYLWHCDASGDYSLYSAPTESYLRGVQVTDSNGQVTFTSIFPACYSGRWPHIHIEVYQDLTTATNGKNALLTTQLAMPKDIATTVFSGSSYYTASTSNLAQVSESTDLVFASSSTAQLAQQTPTFTGSVSAGYTATATVGMGV